LTDENSPAFFVWLATILNLYGISV